MCSSARSFFRAAESFVILCALVLAVKVFLCPINTFQLEKISIKAPPPLTRRTLPFNDYCISLRIERRCVPPSDRWYLINGIIQAAIAHRESKSQREILFGALSFLLNWLANSSDHCYSRNRLRSLSACAQKPNIQGKAVLNEQKNAK